MKVQPLLSASCAIVLAAVSPAPADPASATGPAADAALLKFPYPYRAAVTVCSDIDSATVEKFQAVHELVNTTRRIFRGSPSWSVLFTDPEIVNRESWREGIDGFGLPIADSCWLYQDDIGIFERYDEAAGRPVPHDHNGRDFRDIIDDWMRRGWIDTLHTPGTGHIPRDATAAGLRWLEEKDYRRLTVWVNHSYTVTPSGIAPGGERALPFLVKNLVRCGTGLLCLLGGESIARRITESPYPQRFPPGQTAVCWTLTVLLAGSSLWLLTCLVVRRLRKRRNLIAGLVVLAAASGVSYLIRMNFAQGDDPDSPYYNADLVRRHGFRFYWLLGSEGQAQSVANTLVLPEWNYDGRSSPLRIVRLDDGSRCLAFYRCHKGPGGHQSLELLSEAALEDLCARQGTAILYTHWTGRPASVFTAAGLDGLASLKRFYQAGRVWVAPTSDILRVSFMRTFLDYRVHLEGGRRIIDVIRVNSPVEAAFVPTVADLRGISFECPADLPVEIRLAGKAVGNDALDFISAGDRTIVRFRQQPGSTAPSTSSRASAPGSG